MVTVLELGDVSVDVIFKDIKNVHLSVHPPTGRVRISAPDRMELDNIRLFAITKIGWIKKQQKKLLAQEREQPREYLERESHYLWGDRYLLQISEGQKPACVKAGHRKIELYVPAQSSLQKRHLVLDHWYREEIKAAVPTLIAKWEKQTSLDVNRFFIQKMRTKWGSSNPMSRTIRLNLELAKKPPQCLDYVILHEMLHFLVADHGERFVALMDCYMPNWQIVRQTLNEAPLAHVDWTY